MRPFPPDTIRLCSSLSAPRDSVEFLFLLLQGNLIARSCLGSGIWRFSPRLAPPPSISLRRANSPSRPSSSFFSRNCPLGGGLRTNPPPRPLGLVWARAYGGLALAWRPPPLSPSAAPIRPRVRHVVYCPEWYSGISAVPPRPLRSQCGCRRCRAYVHPAGFYPPFLAITCGAFPILSISRGCYPLF